MSVQMDINVWKTPPVTAHHNLQNSYPVQLLIKGRRVLMVGAGNVALRKTQGLLRAGAEVTVVAPWIDPRVAELPVDIVERRYVEGEAGDYQLVITCTDDPQVNRQVFRDAEAAGVWVNSADDPINCSFILPAVARQGDLTLTISTNGQSPAMAMWLRRKFEAEFDERYDRLMDLLVEVRAEARSVLGTSEVSGWNEALDDGVFELVAQGDTDAARAKLRTCLGLEDPPTTEIQATSTPNDNVLRANGSASLEPKNAETNQYPPTDDNVLRANGRPSIEAEVTANGSASLEPKNAETNQYPPTDDNVLRANESASLEPKNAVTNELAPTEDSVLRANGRPSLEAGVTA